MTKKLIVNADDYGHTAGISRGIREAHLNGIVTSPSAMMNRPHAVQALNTAVETCPRLGLGVHLCLTSGQPLLPPEKVASLVNSDGYFPREEAFISKLHTINIDEVRAEWRAQIESFIKTVGHAPDHLDSHHHSSYFSQSLFENMLELASEFKCRIRRPFGEDSEYESGDLSRSDLKQLFETFAAESTALKPLTTQGFFGRFYDEGVNLTNLKDILQEIVENPELESFEIACHPAYVDDELRAISSYNRQRGLERELLQNEEIVRFARSNLRLIPYAELGD
jgi:predicted glycoside hydrolase/deacetylase ChbG (UPF0249 family)